MKQFHPQQKSNRNRESDFNAQNSDDEKVSSQLEVDHISSNELDQQDDDLHIHNKNKIVNDDQITPEIFKAEKPSSRQLMHKKHKKLKQKKTINMFLNPQTKITSYIDHYDERPNLAALMLAAYIVSTPGCHEMFICKSCNKEVKDRQAFRKHNQTKTHVKNLQYWIEIIEMNNFEDTINNTKRKVSKTTIKEARKAIEMQQNFHDLARARFYNQGYDKEIAHILHKDTSQIKLNDLSQRTNKQNPDAFNKATQSIKDWVPKQFEEFKNQVIHLISRMYFEKDNCKLQIQFNATFYDPKTIKRHWIPEFYENINKQSNPRLFMQQQLKQADLSFAVKSRDQLQEITAICGMARLLFEIFCDCQFVPTAYVILLAILMDTEEQVNYDATIIHLKNGWVIDLSLQSGIAVLNPTIGITHAMSTEPETNQRHQDPVLHVQVASSQSHLPTSMEAKRESQPYPGKILRDNIFLSGGSPHSSPFGTNIHTTSDCNNNQSNIQDDIKLTGMEITTEDHKKANPKWTYSKIYQNSYSSYSSTTSIQSLPKIDFIEDTRKNYDCYPDNEEMAEGEVDPLQDYQNPMEKIPLESHPEPERLTKEHVDDKNRSQLQKDTSTSYKYETNNIQKKNQPNTVVTFNASSGEDQSDEGVETGTEFEPQLGVSSPPPDPIYLAHCLFTHWEEQLNFYEDADRSNDDAFTIETINQLTILVNNASSHHLT